MVNYIKTLGYYDLLFASMGHIIGAGIFSLVGITHKYAENNTWLSIILSGGLIGIIANAYIKLGKIETDQDVEYTIIKKAYGKNISKIVMYCAIIGGIFGTYLVSKSFGNYFSDLSSLSTEISTLLVIGICLLMNISGISNVAIINNIVEIGALGILLLFICIGFYKLIIDKEFKFIKNSFDLNEIKKNIWNIIKGTFIIIFSYFGFELLIKFNRESMNPNVHIPKAIKYSVLFTVIIYTLIAFVYSYAMYIKKKYKSNKNVDNKQNEEKDIPMTNAIQILSNSNKYNKLVTIAGCISTFNTVLFMLAGTARLADTHLNIDTDHSIPKKSLIIISVLSILLFIIKVNLEKSALLSNTFTLILFAGVFLSVNKLKIK
jgi:amino acid transporter